MTTSFLSTASHRTSIMRIFIPQLIAIIAVCIMLPLNADAISITARPVHDPSTRVPRSTDLVSGVQGLHVISTSYSSSTISFTSASRAPQHTHPSSASDVENPTLVLHPFVLVVPTSSSSGTGSPTTKTTSSSDSVGSALEFDVVSTTPSPTTTPSAGFSFAVYWIFALFIFVAVIIPCVIYRAFAYRDTPIASHVELASVTRPAAPPIHPLVPSS